jgi:hypothetical protein
LLDPRRGERGLAREDVAGGIAMPMRVGGARVNLYGQRFLEKEDELCPWSRGGKEGKAKAWTRGEEKESEARETMLSGDLKTCYRRILQKLCLSDRPNRAKLQKTDLEYLWKDG